MLKNTITSAAIIFFWINALEAETASRKYTFGHNNTTSPVEVTIEVKLSTNGPDQIIAYRPFEKREVLYRGRITQIPFLYAIVPFGDEEIQAPLSKDLPDVFKERVREFPFRVPKRLHGYPYYNQAFGVDEGTVVVDFRQSYLPENAWDEEGSRSFSFTLDVFYLDKIYPELAGVKSVINNHGWSDDHAWSSVAIGFQASWYETWLFKNEISDYKRPFLREKKNSNARFDQLWVGRHPSGIIIAPHFLGNNSDWDRRGDSIYIRPLSDEYFSLQEPEKNRSSGDYDVDLRQILTTGFNERRKAHLMSGPMGGRCAERIKQLWKSLEH